MQRDVFDWSHVDAASVRPITLRILIVIDGRILLTKDSQDFGLGYVLETLRAPFAWWVRFHVDVARHDDVAGDGSSLAYPKPFRFTDAGFDIDDYDQVWFFADRPNRQDGQEGVMTDDDVRNDPFALNDAELKLVAEWMDRGGGVFATGDHTVLGGALCHRLPRVRSMRRWTVAQGVPPRSATDRHETLQPAMGGDAETDTILQPLELVDQGGPFIGPLGPHPLFRSAYGLIDRFPDHMHEGEIIPDGEIGLDAPLDIPGYGGVEYPSALEVLASSFAGGLSAFQRPRPRIVAYGRTTNPNYPTEIADAGGVLPLLAFGNAGVFGFTERFGLVGVYDGDSVGIGRVVVDSTWHHWLSINIHSIAQQDEPPVVAFKASAIAGDLWPTAYKKMQAYYRNVARWLATPAQRRAMLVSGTWGVITSAPPDAFSLADNARRVGDSLVETLDRELTPGVVNELAAAFVPPLLASSATRAREAGARAPFTAEIVNRAIVGTIGKSLLEPALEYRHQRDRGLRPRFDDEAIRRRALEGAATGRQLLSQWLDDAAATIAASREVLGMGAKATPLDVARPAAGRRLRVVAKRLQLPDPRDPCLVEGQLAATIRVRLGDDLIGARTLESVRLPALDARGAVVDLELAAGEAEVGPWESLSIEVWAGDWSSRRPLDPEALRFEDTLSGDPAGWVGEHAPARSQPWRLWYTIDDID
jgi:hypothetical protein